MPIIFEHRLSNSESDKKLRKIYNLNHTLWTLYYTLFFAGFGIGIAVLVGVNSSPIFSIIISAVTVVLLMLFLKRQMLRKRHR
jgi:hypothetical protein